MRRWMDWSICVPFVKHNREGVERSFSHTCDVILHHDNHQVSHSMSTEATTAILCINSFTNLVYEALHDSLIIIIMDKGEQPSSLSLVVTRYTVGSPLLTLVLLSSSYTHLFSQQHESCRPPQLNSRRRRRRKSHHHPQPSLSSMEIGTHDTMSPLSTSQLASLR
jgi:hypothetical protein